MENKNTTESEKVARRTTFDGVTVWLHADGSLSTRTHFIGRAKLPLETMWREIDDLSVYTYAELIDFVRACKSGKRQKARDRADWINSGRCAAQVAANSFDRMESARERITHNRNPRAGVIVALAFAATSAIGCASTPRPLETETVGQLSASSTHTYSAPVHATTDLGVGFVSGGDDATGPEVKDVPAIEAPDVTAKTGLVMGGAR